jgi:hypothetical protein
MEVAMRSAKCEFDMSNGADWDFANTEEAKAEIRVAVEYLLRNTFGADRADIVLEIVQMVRDAANAIPAGDPLDEGMPGG